MSEKKPRMSKEEEKEAASECYDEIMELLYKREIGLDHRLMIAAMIYVDCEGFIHTGMGKEAAEVVKSQFIKDILSARKHFQEHHEKNMVKKAVKN